ncbi:MAG TPA: CBS domain-containing protein [Myxococcota bacterium]|nr:CBS domain-containing protein [Myxococcota bacterium]
METAPVTTSPTRSLKNALVAMQLEELESLPVTFEGRLVGVIHRDAILDQVDGGVYGQLLDDPGLEAPVSECMQDVPAVCRPGDPLSSPAMMMNVLDLEQLPVVDANRRLVGVLDRGVVMAEAIGALREVERLMRFEVAA